MGVAEVYDTLTASDTYRYADTADFDTELNVERRISEAGAGG